MRLMRARMTVGLPLWAAQAGSEHGFAPPGGCIRQPDHRQKLLMPGAGSAGCAQPKLAPP